MPYFGNPNLVSGKDNHEYTEEQIKEFIKCQENPVYFCENFVKIVTVDHGIVPFKPYKYQKKLIKTIIKNRYTIAKMPRQCGKCLLQDTHITVRNKITGNIYETTLGNFYRQASYDKRGLDVPEEKLKRNLVGNRSTQDTSSIRERVLNNNYLGNGLSERSSESSRILSNLSDTVNRKFVDSIDIDNFEILSDTGYVNISAIHKTVEYVEWILKTETKDLICADDHIVFREDYSEVFVKNLKPGDKIITDTGIEEVTLVTETDKSSNMFDLSVDSDNHRYYTNGILSHNTTTLVAIMLWLILFNESYRIAILANKEDQSRDILERLQLAYENLPNWLQQPVSEWNKKSIELKNGSSIMAASTSSSAIRGKTFNFIYLDEFAFVPRNIQDQFFASVYPTITSGTTSKIAITSTPHGLDLFYKIWVDSENGRNSYERVDIHWSDTPGRDEKWKEEVIKNTSELQFAQEFGTEFLGSSNTLIRGSVISKLAFFDPLREMSDVKVYADSVSGETYALIADTSRGVGLDYSAFIVVNTSRVPYEVVATFRDNNISVMAYPSLIHNVALYYNEALVCVEINDNGQQIVDDLFEELEYENILMSQTAGRSGTSIGGDNPKTARRGLRTTQQVKRIGCYNLKSLVESDQIILKDFTIINELSTFISKNNSYEADAGNNDDMVMCLVLFAWMANQKYFRELTDTDARDRLLMDNDKQMLEKMTPFGVISNGESILNIQGGFAGSEASTDILWLLGQGEPDF